MGRLIEMVVATSVLMPTVGFAAEARDSEEKPRAIPNFRYSAELAKQDTLPVTKIFEAARKAASDYDDVTFGGTGEGGGKVVVEGRHSSTARILEKLLGTAVLVALAGKAEQQFTSPGSEQYLKPSRKATLLLGSALYYTLEDLLTLWAQIKATDRFGTGSGDSEPSAIEYVATVFNRRLPRNHSQLSGDIAAFQIVAALHKAELDGEQAPQELEKYRCWAAFRSAAIIQRAWLEASSKAEPAIFRRMKAYIRDTMKESNSPEGPSLDGFMASLQELVWGQPEQPRLEDLAIHMLRDSMMTVDGILSKWQDDHEKDSEASSAEEGQDVGDDDFVQVPDQDQSNAGSEDAAGTAQANNPMDTALPEPLKSPDVVGRAMAGVTWFILGWLTATKGEDGSTSEDEDESTSEDSESDSEPK